MQGKHVAGKLMPFLAPEVASCRQGSSVLPIPYGRIVLPSFSKGMQKGKPKNPPCLARVMTFPLPDQASLAGHPAGSEGL